MKRGNAYFKRPPHRPRRVINYEDRIDYDLLKPDIESQYSAIQSLIKDSELREQYLDKLEDINALSANEFSEYLENFHRALELSTAFPNPQILEIIFNTWHYAFSNTEGINQDLKNFQTNLLRSKDKLTNRLIDTGKFKAYQRLITPLHIDENVDVEHTWSDTLANTFQFERTTDGRSTFNESTIENFLRNKTTDLSQKRKLLGIFLRRGLQNVDVIEDRYTIIRTFIKSLGYLQDDHLLLVDSSYSEYQSGIRLISMNPPGIDFALHIKNLKNIILETYDDKKVFFNFLTTLMKGCVEFSPQSALNYWEYKFREPRNGKALTSVFNSMDLTICMNALSKDKQYDRVLNVYGQFVQFHHDDQIEILLKVTAASQNWKLLQAQFEEMYGRGDLPYIVHYSVVMNSLANIGSREDVEKLYHQLLKRNLKLTDSIYVALINSSIYHDDFDGSMMWFDEYLEKVEEGSIESSPSPYLYSLVFKSYIKSNDLPKTMEFLESSLERQKKHNTKLIDAQVLKDLVNFAGTSYSPKNIEIVRKLAKSLNITLDYFYVDLIRAYTRVCEFEKAEEIAYEAHMESLLPFKNARIYKAQLRNLRFWYRYTAKGQKTFILDRIWFILEVVYSNSVISPKNIHGLYSEMIKYFLNHQKVGDAQGVLAISKDKKILTEDHYSPFLQHYAKYHSFSGNSNIIAMYREMAANKVNITAKTYVQLMHALLGMDNTQNNGYVNSYKLLQSVFELNGLTMSKDDNTKRVISPEGIYDQCVDLCRIVLSYAMANTKDDLENFELISHFLAQIRAILGKTLTTQFRFMIYLEMGKLYHYQGQVSLTRKLVESGIEEIHEVCETYIREYPYSESKDLINIPVSLQLTYRKLISLSMKCMARSRENPESYIKLFEDADSRNIKLSGKQYYTIISEVLKDKQNPKSLPIILTICEKHLVDGNFVESMWARNLQFLYKLVILNQIRQSGDLRVFQDFKILNNFYNVKDLKKLDKEFEKLDNPMPLIIKEVLNYNSSWGKYGILSIGKLFHSISRTFSPEKQLTTRYKMPTNLMIPISNSIKDYCNNNKVEHYKLMNEYPKTIEYVNYFKPARLRYSYFRREINKIIPEPEGYEDYNERQIRTIKALNVIQNNIR